MAVNARNIAAGGPPTATDARKTTASGRSWRNARLGRGAPDRAGSTCPPPASCHHSKLKEPCQSQPDSAPDMLSHLSQVRQCGNIPRQRGGGLLRLRSRARILPQPFLHPTPHQRARPDPLHPCVSPHCLPHGVRQPHRHRDVKRPLRLQDDDLIGIVPGIALIAPLQLFGNVAYAAS